VKELCLGKRISRVSLKIGVVSFCEVSWRETKRYNIVEKECKIVEEKKKKKKDSRKRENKKVDRKES